MDLSVKMGMHVYSGCDEKSKHLFHKSGTWLNNEFVGMDWKKGDLKAAASIQRKVQPRRYVKEDVNLGLLHTLQLVHRTSQSESILSPQPVFSLYTPEDGGDWELCNVQDFHKCLICEFLRAYH